MIFLKLFTKFPVLNMEKISEGSAWENNCIDLFVWLDDLDLETVCMTVKWIRQFIEDDDEWSRDLSWSRYILLKACY